MVSSEILQTAMKVPKEITIKALKKFINDWRENEKIDSDTLKILKSQVSSRTNLSAIQTHVNFNDHPLELNIRLTIYLDNNYNLHEILTTALNQNVAFPYKLKVNSYYLCHTPDRDYYLFHPSESTSLDYGIQLSEDQLIETLKGVINALKLGFLKKNYFHEKTNCG